MSFLAITWLVSSIRCIRYGTVPAVAACMIRRTKQNWNIGLVVKVGFLTLTVVATNGVDYLLENAKGRFFEFTPYRGLNTLTTRFETDRWARWMQS
jgi:hypothetical protein